RSPLLTLSFDCTSFGLPSHQQFDPVSERISDVEALVSGQWLILDNHDARFCQPGSHRRKVVDLIGDMRLGRWAEILVDTEMKLQVAGLEPASAPRNEVRGLGHLSEAKKTAVERPRGVLATGRNRDLDVMDGGVSVSHGRCSRSCSGVRRQDRSPAP